METITNFIAADGLAAKIVISVAVLIAGWIVIKVVCMVLKKALDRSALDAVLYPFVLNTTRVVLWLMIILTVLSYLGVPMSAFITAIGAAGVAIALALKDSLSNFAGGILILLSKPFKKGDFIEDLQVSGKVEEINMLYTTIMTNDNKIITMPNGKLANATVINYTKENLRRVDMKFPVAYEADIQKVKELLLTTSSGIEHVLQEPAPFAGVSKYEENAVHFDLYVWCETPYYWDVKYAIQEKMKNVFENAGISVPSPMVDVRIARRDVIRY